MQGWARSFPCAVLEGEKECLGSFPPRETITGVILESEPREGPPTSPSPLAWWGTSLLLISWEQRRARDICGIPGQHPKPDSLLLEGCLSWPTAGQAGGGSQRGSQAASLCQSKSQESLSPVGGCSLKSVCLISLTVFFGFIMEV